LLSQVRVHLVRACVSRIAHLRIEAPPEKIQEAVRLCQKMAQEGLQKVNITKIADPPRRRSSMRQSLLDEVETIDPPQ
jgi:hypothetical protein